MWQENRFERKLNQLLTTEFGQVAGSSFFSKYIFTRDRLIREIEQIRAVEPMLSDHGPRHIANVLENACDLVFENEKIIGLSGIDLYILAQAILFHDVGNLKGREAHNLKIGEVFDWARGSSADLRREKHLIVKAAQAHTGTSPLGGRNTLDSVDILDHFDGKQVQLRNIAAILRFADELAEGPQRTTDYYRSSIGYSDKSENFHRYASCTHVSIDRLNGRVRLTYEIQLDEFDGNELNRQNQLATFLGFILERIIKLDEERRYTRYYCPILSVFKLSDITINFSSGSQILQSFVRFQLDDLVVPGEKANSIESVIAGKCDSPAGIAATVFKVLQNEASK
jgi:hypothetical protein